MLFPKLWFSSEISFSILSTGPLSPEQSSAASQPKIDSLPSPHPEPLSSFEDGISQATTGKPELAQTFHPSTNKQTVHKAQKDSGARVKDSCLEKRAEVSSPDINQLKDQQLREEERLLLAKLHLLSGDSSPVSGGHRGLKRLIPDRSEMECGASELGDKLEEISLSDTEELLPDGTRRGMDV